MESEALRDLVVAGLEDGKGIEVKVFDVQGMTTITDHMIIATGTSDRHVKALADRVVAVVKEKGVPVHGIEGQSEGEWILVDLQDVVVHVMLPQTRDFYNLEKLWGATEDRLGAERGARSS